MNLKIKEFNCKKKQASVQFYTENDADMFILRRRIINARQNIRRISEIF